MTTMDATAGGMPKASNFEIIKRLLGFMTPFNTIMFTSLTARSIKFIGQAAVLGIGAASIGIYIQGYNPDEVMSLSTCCP